MIQSKIQGARSLGYAEDLWRRFEILRRTGVQSTRRKRTEASDQGKNGVA